jgi:CubicO group peptidase (beta-lactamase class C family)
MNALDAARELIEQAVRERIFPAAVAEVGSSDAVVWRQPFGRLTFESGAPPASDHTIFDLASLTKPLATTSVVMQLESEKRLDIREPVATFFSEWRGEDREQVTILDLLEHASGLAARLVDAPPRGRREFEHEICTMHLEYAPRTRSVYSDLGFILLGFIAADRGDAPFDRQFAELVRRLSASRNVVRFDVSDISSELIAPTLPEPNDPRRGRTLAGEVHDDYAWALGGVAGHAGTFGSAEAVGELARTILRGARNDADVPAPFSPPLVRTATRKSTVPVSSRALGWDTMLPTSSCGRWMSASAFGHVGFTGTSLWVDPQRDRYFVLLTNRVCGGGTIEQMRDVRRAFHDALADL